MEMFFEEFNFTATYFPATPMLGAFCYGRSTGMVIDLGASHTTISPVVDGFVLEKSVITTSRGGNWLDAQILGVLGQENITVNPWYEKDGFPIKNITAPLSFRNYHVNEVLRDLKHWMCFVSSSPLIVDGVLQPNSRVPEMPSYELPDGSIVVASEPLCLVTERLFVAGRTRVAPVVAPPKTQGNSAAAAAAVAAAVGKGKAGILSAPLMPGVPTHSQRLDINPSLDPLHELIYASLAKCDADCRKEIAGNIVLVGGGSLIDGLQPRLAAELAKLLPAHMKVCALLSTLFIPLIIVCVYFFYLHSVL